jgi:lipoprotein-anchoring transpeptidase ErfK/SrfK
LFNKNKKNNSPEKEIENNNFELTQDEDINLVSEEDISEEDENIASEETTLIDNQEDELSKKIEEQTVEEVSEASLFNEESLNEKAEHNYSDEEKYDEILDDEEDEEKSTGLIEAEKAYKKHKRNKTLIKVFSIVLGALALIYIGGAIFFNSHFLPNSTVNGKAVSFKTSAYLTDEMKNEVSDYSLHLVGTKGTSAYIKGKDIDAKFKDDKEAEKLITNQDNALWFTSFWKHNNIKKQIGVTYDKTKLNSLLKEMPMLDKKKQIPSENAKPVFDGSKYIVKAEVIGTSIDNKKFKEVLEKSIDGFLREVNLEDEGCYIKPEYVSTSDKVIAATAAMNSYLKAKITYNLNPTTLVVDAKTIAPWISVDKDMRVKFNEAKVTDYVQKLANKVNTFGKTRNFKTATGQIVKVEGGDFGWVVDKDAEKTTLVANIKNGDVVTREPIYSQKAVSHAANDDYGTTYAEVNLTTQHMWYIKNGKVIMDTDVVTGNPNNGHSTPQGVYQIVFKQSPAVLKGEVKNGKPEYETPVTYWMPFNGGIGFHDANWQPYFGGDRYKIGGSHGCVNMPPEMAKKLYGLIATNTPVICHY